VRRLRFDEQEIVRMVTLLRSGMHEQLRRHDALANDDSANPPTVHYPS
jgi:hypothetical protein